MKVKKNKNKDKEVKVVDPTVTIDLQDSFDIIETLSETLSSLDSDIFSELYSYVEDYAGHQDYLNELNDTIEAGDEEDAEVARKDLLKAGKDAPRIKMSELIEIDEILDLLAPMVAKVSPRLISELGDLHNKIRTVTKGITFPKHVKEKE